MRPRPPSVLLAIAATFACAEIAGSDSPAPPIDGIDGTFAITHVDVIAVRSGDVLRDHTVIIRDGRIEAVGPSDRVRPAPDMAVFEGRDRYLVPGLIDMHVHINAADLEAYVRHGVTTVRNMWGYDELVPIIADVEEGRRVGPHIISLTAGFDGSPAVWPQTQLTDDVASIRAKVERQAVLGFREIKMYQRLSRVAWDTLVTLAAEMNLTFAGHLPNAVPLRVAIDAGQRSIEHLGGFRTSTRLEEDAAYAAGKGLYVCPTLEVQSILNRGSGDATRTAITRTLHQHGVKLLAGTDAGIGATAPGSSMHDELRRLVQAGLSPQEALRSATTRAADYLGESERVGGIAVGMEADLLLVRDNPLDDIDALRRIDAVFVDGVRRR